MKNPLLFFFSCMLFASVSASIYAESNHSADVSYLVADFKYSQEDGVKICEVQHGSLSAMQGDVFVNGGDGKISPQVAEFFSRFPMKKWAVGVIYPPLKRSLIAKGWDVDHSLKSLFKDPVFLKVATLPPHDPSSINAYAGIVYGDYDLVRDYDAYHKAYPGILFINAVTFPYWRDKFSMNSLFEQSDELKAYKADWKLYPKIDDPQLAESVMKAMPAELYVIKPRSQSLANGVLVVAKDDLTQVLKLILEPSPTLENHPDKKYAYWFKSKDEYFLIEKFYKSDYLTLPRPVSDTLSRASSYHYDATMRIAFILQNDGGKLTYHALGGFWKLPYKSLEEDGTLNEKRISYGEPPYYQAVDPRLLKQVNTHLERAMLLLYEKMLQNAVR